MAEFKTVSLADQVFEKLENDIIVGVYSRGEIITELKLAEQLGVSRTPIREALRRLEHERLISDSAKGSVVLGITKEDLIDIMTIRIQVEGLAAYYASENLDDAGIERLNHIKELQEFYYSKRDIGNLRKIDDQFHYAVYELCRHNVLQDTLLPLHRKTQRFRRISIEDPNRLPLSVQEHGLIYEALVARDSELAAKRMEEHIRNAKENMIMRLKTYGDDNC